MLSWLDTPIGDIDNINQVSQAGKIYAILPTHGGDGGKALARGQKLTRLISLAQNTCDDLFKDVMEKQVSFNLTLHTNNF